MPSNSNLGVVLLASGDGSGAYTTRSGEAGTVRTLTAQNYTASPWLDVGRLADLFITISGTISAQMGGVLVRVERRRLDEQNNALFRPALIATARADQPAAPRAIEQTIARADLVGQSVSAWPNVAPAIEVLDVVLVTTDHRWGQCRVLVKAVNAPAASDVIVIAANGGG